MTRALFFFISTAAAALVGASAFAQGIAAVQQLCDPKEALLGRIQGKFKEAPILGGIVNDRVIMRLFVAEQGTWTIIMIDANGNACIAGVGKDLETFDALGQPTTGM